MAIRNIYLKIEQIPGYSSVEPEIMIGPPKQYRRDCMRNPGHEDGTIPGAEVDARRLTAIVYREYLDPNYLVPKPDKLILADINEPMYHRRVPGTVIYTHPGERLRIHVLNADIIPHSFHLHGLSYGIDSDGSWPLGTQSSDGRRSDEICPGQNWIYTYDVTEKMIGAWPFHDHSRQIGASINRGLFGGIVVLRRGVNSPPRPKLPPVVERFLRERAHDLRVGTVQHIPQLADLPQVKRNPITGHAMAMDMGGMTNIGGGMMAEGGDFTAAAISSFLEELTMRSDFHPTIDRDDVIHVPLFFHFMGGSAPPAFNSGALPPGAPPFEVTFGAEGVFTYHCELHPTMQGKVTVIAGGPSDAYVTIQPAMLFDPPQVTVRPGGKVHWAQAGITTHTVTEDGGGMPSYCFNGRSFVGNTPTIVAHAGQKIRWYVFNLDVGMMWHNFHPHSIRWTFAQETIDVRSIGPAESFIVETTAPPVLLLPNDIQKAQNPKYRPRGAKRYKIRGDFLFHCHVEMHMMQGLTGLVRSQQTLWLTSAQRHHLEVTTGLPLDDGSNACPPVDNTRCQALDCGKWELVPALPEVTMMHAALLPGTEKVLYWGHGDLNGSVPNQSRIWDYSTPAGAYSMPPNQPHDVAINPADRFTWDIWSAEHAFLNTAEGTLLVHGGFAYKHAFLFDPTTLHWSRIASTAEDRFYATTLTLGNGKVLTLFGNGPTIGVARSIEVFDPGTSPSTGTWSTPKQLPTGPPNAPANSFNYLFYPWTYLLPGGDLFIAGHQGTTVRFDWTATPIVISPLKTWNTNAGERSTASEKGTSVLLPLRPPNYEPRVLIAGGDSPASQQSFEIIDLSATTPAWVQPKAPDGITPLLLNQPRVVQVNSVLLPDGRVLIVGGVTTGPDGGAAEIFDPANPAVGWKMCGVMQYKRGYHSVAILLADGSVVVGGDPPGTWGDGGHTPNERYYPSYYFKARPVITSASGTTNYGAGFTINTPNAASITEVVLLRPGAVTHGFNMSQRFIGCAITGGGATTIQAQAPPNGNVAPPGWYLLFIVDAARVPSVAKWIRLTP